MLEENLNPLMTIKYHISDDLITDIKNNKGWKSFFYRFLEKIKSGCISNSDYKR